MEATGASRGEAFGLAALALGEPAVRPHWDAWAKHQPNFIPVLRMLNEVARHLPEAANEWLSAWLATAFQGEGTLTLDNRAWVTSLPAHLTVSNLELRETAIPCLPPHLTVRGVLDLRQAHTTTLSEGLTVGEDLLAMGSDLRVLPADLRVGGDLALYETPVAALPSGLRVGGGLYLANTQIAELPGDLRVFGTLDLRGTPLATLPDGLAVGDDLDLGGSQIQHLPERLAVAGSLNLMVCVAWDGRIPQGVTVGNAVHTSRHANGIALDEWRSLYPEGEPPLERFTWS
jgi:hypothetical protein